MLLKPAALFIVSLLSSAVLAASPKYFISIKGQKTGNIYHNNITTFVNVAPITLCNFSVNSPRDALSGLPTGKLQIFPVKLEKEMDQSTPLLLQLAVNNENFQAVITGVEPATNAHPATTFAWKLTNCNMVNVVHDARDGQMVEEISMVFQKLEIDATANGNTIMAELDWQDPIA